MLMKVHSYLATNGALSEKAIQLRQTQKALNRAVEDGGGWSKVLYQASREAASRSTNGDHASEGKKDDSALVVDGSSSTLAAPDGKPALHRRRKSSSRSNSSLTTVKSRDIVAEDKDDPKDPKRLVDYEGDEKIWNLANDCVDLQEELTSAGKEAVVWPANVTYANYIDYLLVPTLVYELEYPRTSSIRPLYVLEKTLATFGTFFLIYAITEHVIFPHHESSKSNPIRANNFLAAALDLVLPFMINYLLIFYIIFECVCNGFAELTRFADRGFYSDWWNAVTWDEFARKWNKPVHQVGF
jgi:sterol O-acyltransferase